MAYAATAEVGVGVREIIGRVRLRREASTNHQAQRDLPGSIAASSLHSEVGRPRLLSDAVEPEAFLMEPAEGHQLSSPMRPITSAVVTVEIPGNERRTSPYGWFLRISHETLYKLMRQGLPSHRVGRKRVFIRQELMDWVRDH